MTPSANGGGGVLPLAPPLDLLVRIICNVINKMTAKFPTNLFFGKFTNFRKYVKSVLRKVGFSREEMSEVFF